MMMKRILALCVVSAVTLGLGAVSAQAGLYDLTGPGSGGYDTAEINNALFYNCNQAPTGSGNISSFVRISTNHDVEQGYNTDYRPLEFDENNSGTFTHFLLASSAPIVNIGGTDYREFLLDINQDKSGPDRLLSLDQLEIFLGTAGNLTGYPSGLGTKIYDMDAGLAEGQDNWILLDSALAGSGSGKGDMYAYILASKFGSSDYVYLYSKFGVHNKNTGGYEEWAVREATNPVVPVPAGFILGLLGLSAAGWKLRRFA